MAVRDKLLMWGILLSAILCRREIDFFGLRGVALGDVLLSLMAGKIAWSVFVSQAPLALPRHFSRIFAFWFWALLGGLFFALTDSFLFSSAQFFMSFTRLTFFGISSIFIFTFFKKQETTALLETLLDFLFINGLISVGIVMLVSLNLPYGQSVVYWGESAAAQATMFYRTTHFVVAKGLFSEPSMLALFQCFGLGLIWLGGKPLHQHHWGKFAIVILSVLMSFSLTGYFLLGLLIMLQMVKSKRVPWGWLFLAGIVLGGVLLIPNVYSKFNEAISGRFLYRTLGGLDDSFSSRILASWNIPLMVFFDSPFWGTGLGNMVLRYPLSEYGYYFHGRAESWNTLAYVLGTTGVIGAVLFLSFIFGVCPQKGLGWLFFLTFFGNGGFLETFFWIQLVLYLYVQGRSMNLEFKMQQPIGNEKLFLRGFST